MAPSGVLMIGLALVMRDLVQRRLGVRWAVAAILCGAIASAFLAPAALVVASTVAFLMSEFADLAIYTPLQRRRLMLAVLLSSLIGLVIDSAVFLYLAFGSLTYVEGQVIGKAWMVLLAMPAIWWIRERDQRLGLSPAAR
ncbi:MAG: VUT family protein [Rhodospirillales bacterium]|nr:VUT family protein [Rhodospirillales bacterium]